jgi:hypothetical protein
LTVLTLDRAVSIRDYRDFARAFAVSKAQPSDSQRTRARALLTVAGERAHGGAGEQRDTAAIFRSRSGAATRRCRCAS